jgi:MFS family permease
MDATPKPPAALVEPGRSALAPLAHPLFRRLWIAQIVSQIGGFMTEVALGWQMATLSSSPLMVSLLVTATSLPFFLLSMPAGALADIVDRRRLLLTAQVAMVFVSATLATFAALGWSSPGVLLGLAAALGTAAAFNGPAWFAIPAEVLPREHLEGGVTLNGVAMNIARVVGPALGGFVVASLGAAVAFGTDAASTSGVIAALLVWKRAHVASVLPAERLASAMKAGLRFARHGAGLRVVLVRVAAFIVCGSVVMGLLPVLARQVAGGAAAYGWLLGSFGLGAVAAAVLLPRIRARYSSDAQVLAGTVIFGAACLGIAFGRTLWALCPLLLCAGTGWICVLSTLSVSSQKVSPPWVRARAIAVFLLVLQGGLAAGSAIWGWLAQRAGIDAAFLGAAAALGVGAIVTLRLRIAPHEQLDLAPTRHWPDPASLPLSELASGPVLVEVEYRVDPAQSDAFLRALAPLERMRRRDGSMQWWILRSTDDPSCWIEVFSAETWAEHLRQHERASADYRAVEDAARAFHLGPEPPRVRHFVAPSRR